MNNILIMERRKPLKRVFEDSLRCLELQVLLSQAQKMTLQMLVDEH
jgi:hypothetical protein